MFSSILGLFLGVPFMLILLILFILVIVAVKLKKRKQLATNQSSLRSLSDLDCHHHLSRNLDHMKTNDMHESIRGECELPSNATSISMYAILNPTKSQHSREEVWKTSVYTNENKDDERKENQINAQR